MTEQVKQQDSDSLSQEASGSLASDLGTRPKVEEERPSDGIRNARPSPRPRMPAEFVEAADAAIARHRKRKWAPEIWDTGEAWECPYAQEDHDRWFALLFEIFGTRQAAVVDVFFAQLQEFAGKNWKSQGGWITDEKEMRTLFSIIASLKPRNEAEAAYAAQLCALHMAAMKLGQSMGSTWGGDPRTIAVLNKTVRAFGEGLLNFRRMQGKGRRTVQVIKVETHRHEHKHKHLEGGSQFGGQPHATGASLLEAGTPMPSARAVRSALPRAGGEG